MHCELAGVVIRWLSACQVDEDDDDADEEAGDEEDDEAIDDDGIKELDALSKAAKGRGGTSGPKKKEALAR